MMTIDQFEELRGAVGKAQTDDTPFISTADDEIHVFGNPNKTEVRSADYMVRFAFPDTKEWRKRSMMAGDKVVKEIDGYFCVEREYNGVYLSPRRMSDAITALTMLEQFMNDITEDGEVKALSYEEMKEVMLTMYAELKDATYDLVASVLGVSPLEKDWMLPMSVMQTAIAIVKNNPSAVNEADLFFE